MIGSAEESLTSKSIHELRMKSVWIYVTGSFCFEQPWENCIGLLVSAYVVCERLSAMHYHIPVTRIECPHSSIWRMWYPIHIPPPKKTKIEREVGALGLSWSRVPTPPPPPPWKFGQDLGLWLPSSQEYLAPSVCVCVCVCVCVLKLITVSHLIHYLHVEFIIYSIYINHSIAWNNIVHSIV